jgi:hypothetical protein
VQNDILRISFVLMNNKKLKDQMSSPNNFAPELGAFPNPMNLDETIHVHPTKEAAALAIYFSYYADYMTLLQYFQVYLRKLSHFCNHLIDLLDEVPSIVPSELKPSTNAVPTTAAATTAAAKK